MSQQSLASESAGQAASVEQAAARPAYHLDWLLIVLASLILFLCRSTRLPAMDPDESRCAVAVQQMLDSGNWLIANSKKPAAFFWLAAAAQKATEPLFGKVGSVQLAGRLVSAIAGCLAVLIAYSWAKRLGGRAAGLAAAAVLATTGEFLFVARWYRMDMAFTAAMLAAVWWFARADMERENALATRKTPNSIWQGWIGFYFFAAVATLVKGPAGLVMPLLIIFAYLAARQQLKRLLGVFHPLGILVFLAIAAPWYVAVFFRDRTFFNEFFAHQNVQRFTGSTDLGKPWPAFYYVPILLLGLMPWTALLPGVVIRALKQPGIRLVQNPRFLLWMAVLVPSLIVTITRARKLSTSCRSLRPGGAHGAVCG